MAKSKEKTILKPRALITQLKSKESTLANVRLM